VSSTTTTELPSPSAQDFTLAVGFVPLPDVLPVVLPDPDVLPDEPLLYECEVLWLLLHPPPLPLPLLRCLYTRVWNPVNDTTTTASTATSRSLPNRRCMR
jgi:hypothetical protein